MSYISNLANRVNSIEAKDKFNLQELDINMLVPSNNNFYGIREIEELAVSIKESGLMHNLVVRKLADGKYEILSGERRYRALLSLNITKVPCQVKELNDVDSELLLIKANAEQRELTPMEKMEAVNRLERIYKNKKASGEEIPKGKLRDVIGKDIGLSGTQVGRYQKVDKKVIEPLKKKLDEGTISLKQAEILSNLTEDEQGEMYTKVNSMDSLNQKDEIDILISGINQSVETKEDKELLDEMYQTNYKKVISSKKDELLKLLEMDKYPRLLLFKNDVISTLYTAGVRITDDKAFNLEIRLTGSDRRNLLNITLNEFTKVDKFPNMIEPKYGYEVSTGVYLWFKKKEVYNE